MERTHHSSERGETRSRQQSLKPKNLTTMGKLNALKKQMLVAGGKKLKTSQGLLEVQENGIPI